MSFKLYGPNAFYMPAPPPREHLRLAFGEQLRRWDRPVPTCRDGTPTGEQKVRAAIKLLDGALKRLGSRDRGGIKAQLRKQRDALTSALAAYERIGPDLNGPLASELIDKLTRARAATAQAEAELDRAVGEDVHARRANLDVVQAEGRAVGREVEAAIAAATFPELPRAEAFKAAEASTNHLAHWIKRGTRPAATLAEALRQGAEAAPEEARLWIIYEDDSSDVFEWRWRRFTERARDGEGAIVAPSTAAADAKPSNPKGLSPELFAGRVRL